MLRRRRLLLLLLLLVSGLLLLQRHPLPLRIDQLQWRDGPTLGAWEWRDAQCLRAHGDNLRLSGLWPLRLQLGTLHLNDCGDADATGEKPLAPERVLALIAYAPALDLTIDALHLPGLPALPVRLTQEQQRWQLRIAPPEAHLDARLDAATRHWQLDAALPLTRLHPDMSGEARLQGAGKIEGDAVTGRLDIVLRDAGPSGSASRADADIVLNLSPERWQAEGVLSAPLALPGGWRAEAGRLFSAHGQAATPLQLDGTLHLVGPQGELQLQLQPLMTPLNATGGRLRLDGRLYDQPIEGTLDIARDGEGLQGQLDIRASNARLFDQGGDLSLHLPWRLHDATLIVPPDARATQAEGLIGNRLLRPVTLRPLDALRVDARGLHGTLELQAEGLTAARESLPALRGVLRLKGYSGALDLEVPQWGTRARLSAELGGKRPKGRLQLDTPLVADMLQSLNVIARAGTLEVSGAWTLNKTLDVDAELRLAQGVFESGGLLAEGVSLEGQLGYAGGMLRLTGTRPLVIRRLGLGVDITDIHAGWRFENGVWVLRGLRADALGGTFSGPQLSWPAQDFETLTATALDLSQLARLQQNPLIELSGRVYGVVPVRINAQGIALHDARLYNSGPLILRLPQDAATRNMAEANTAVQLALDTLSHLHVESLDARLDMPTDGWLNARITLKGHNPERNKLPVVFNYTHQENLYDLLRSLRIAQEVTDRALRGQSTEKTQGETP